MKTKIKSQLLDKLSLKKTVEYMAEEIKKLNPNTESLVIIGMRTRGAHLARRITDILFGKQDHSSLLGFLDVTFYRDDFRTRLKTPSVQASQIPFSIDEKNVVLVDDVLYTGRTVRAALDALMDLGRPACIQLAVLVDRWQRELPIQPQVTGKDFVTMHEEEIRVLVEEEDGEDGVYLVELEVNS